MSAGTGGWDDVVTPGSPGTSTEFVERADREPRRLEGDTLAAVIVTCSAMWSLTAVGIAVVVTR